MVGLLVDDPEELVRLGGIEGRRGAQGAGRGALDGGRREAYIQAAEEYTPLGLVGHPDHVAHAILYLVSQTGDFVTGQIIRPNGGLQMPW